MSNKNNNSPGLMPAVAFVAVLALGVVSLFIFLTNSDILTVNATIQSIFWTVGIALGAFVAAYYSFRFAKSRGMVWFVIWAIAIVLIIVFLVLGIVL